MTKYFTNDAAFDVGTDPVVDETFHAIEVEIEGAQAELVVTRAPIGPDGRSPRADATARAAEDGEQRASFAVLGERDREYGGEHAAEVCARFHTEEGAVYQRRAHFVVRGVALTFALRAPFTLRDACDVWMDRVLESLRFRGEDA